MQANDGTPFYTTIHLPRDGSFVSPAWTADGLIARARDSAAASSTTGGRPLYSLISIS